MNNIEYVYPQGVSIAEIGVSEGGITLRDHFAALAMQGMCAADGSFTMDSEKIAAWAYQMAEAMLKSRNA